MSDWIDECPNCGAHSFDTVDNYCMDCGHGVNEQPIEFDEESEFDYEDSPV